MELAGQTIEARSAPPVAAWAFLLIALAMLALAAGIGNVHWAMGAVFPAVLSTIIWLRRPRRRTFSIDDRGLAMLDRGEAVPFDSIKEITVDGVRWCPEAVATLKSPLLIHHARGVLTVPPRLNVPADELFRLLNQKMPAPAPRECPPLLASYHAEHTEKFGTAKVTLIHGRRRFHPMPTWTALFNLALAATITGIAWLLLASIGTEWFPHKDQRDAWLGAGSVALIIGIPFWIFAAWRSTASPSSIKIAKEACLVLTPAGMAMVQGDLKGAMRWEEVRKVRHVPGGTSILLTVPGSTLQVLNVYERSLDEIAMLVRRNVDC